MEVADFMFVRQQTSKFTWNISFWNVRGLNNPLKQDKVLQRAHHNKVDVLCLLETRVKKEKSVGLLETKFAKWNVYTNYEYAQNGRIWILLKKDLDFSLCDVSSQSITVKGSFQGATLIITAAYGSNDGISRRLLWHQLREIDIKYGHLPWIVGGDFNIILKSNETSAHELLGPVSSPEMKDFQEVTQELALQDHPFFGPLFTWSRSDHCMALVLLNKEVEANRPKPFKFFNFWALHPSFIHEVHQSWQPTIQGNPMQVLFSKLKRLKGSLKRLNKDCYSDISNRFQQKKIELEMQQLSTLRGDDTLEKELTLQKELKSLEEAELMFLKQKGKAQWLKEGDRCTKFFHSIIAAKNKRDTIRVIVDDQGRRLESFDNMATEVINYFKSLIGTADPSVTNCDPTLLKDLLHYTLPIGASSDLVKGVSTEEIKAAIFNQGNDKAPGPDGYTPYFFKNAGMWLETM
ncbi:uncharacterized protein LOC120162766 [Hibiscus syriacus]|uniref:uncharacterized protein LOC120162766 n=1 Tax=Hibiscus syriacus TaxID=106335 RepID=UPI001922A4E0|nr:uncharacterized protein LOC120162766 [Hibiscus syriacus]